MSTGVAPDFIVSGINAGSNAGRNILYSGTVAGIIEGVMHDISGAAFSSFDFEDTPFARDVPYIKEIVKYLLKSPLPKGSFFNVNFPSPHTYSEIKGCKLVKQGKEYWAESPDKRSHPYGHAYYWMGSKLAQFDEDEDSDVVWLKQGYMTALLIAISELTDYAQLKSRKESFESIDSCLYLKSVIANLNYFSVFVWFVFLRLFVTRFSFFSSSFLICSCSAIIFKYFFD